MVNRRQPREKVTAEVPHCVKDGLLQGITWSTHEPRSISSFFLFILQFEFSARLLEPARTRFISPRRELLGLANPMFATPAWPSRGRLAGRTWQLDLHRRVAEQNICFADRRVTN
jgi:hypothetical protein